MPWFNMVMLKENEHAYRYIIKIIGNQRKKIMQFFCDIFSAPDYQKKRTAFPSKSAKSFYDTGLNVSGRD